MLKDKSLEQTIFDDLLKPAMFDNISYEDLPKTIKEVIETKPDLSKKDIISLINSINIYYLKKNKSKEIEYNYFDKVIDLYDKDLDNDNKFNILFKINIRESFIKYAKKHYTYFKERLEKTIFIKDFYPEDDEILEDVLDKLDPYFRKNNYKIEIGNFNEVITFPLYQLFFNDIRSTSMYNYEVIKYDTVHLNYMSFDELTKVFNMALNQEISQEEILRFLIVFYKKKNKEDFKIHSLYKIINTKEKIEKITETFKNRNQYLENNSVLSYIYYNMVFLDNSEDYDINNGIPEDLFSLSYIKALNKIEKLSSIERKQSSLYLKCFQIFFKTFISNYKDKITKEDINILEALFQRIINCRNIFYILAIDNKKSLYHYYKTNKLNLDINLSFELIKNYNAKHYLELLNLYHQISGINNYNDELFIITALNILEYDLTKKIINKDSIKLSYIVMKLNEKPNDYIEKIKPLLLDIIDLSKDYEFDSILYIYDLLYKQNDNNIKIKRIRNILNSVSYLLLPNNYLINNDLEKLNLVHKGEPLNEKIEGIKLYDEYRFRIFSSIPDIEGQVNNCNYEMVDMHSPEILSNGIGKYIIKDTANSSCLTPAGKAASCLRHGAINPHGRFFKVTYQDKIIAYSWVWRCGQVLCFDNIEVTENSYKLNNPEYIIYAAYKQAAESIIKIPNKNEEIGIKLVVIGRNEKDVSNSFIDELPKVNDYTKNLFKPNAKDNLYLEDSSKKQLILSGKYKDDLKTSDIEPIYKYRRKEVKRFSNCDKEYLRREINSIYFDYCLENNNKYETITPCYTNGYLNEDWFVGYKENNAYDFYYRGNDDRLFTEAKAYLKKGNLQNISAPHIIKPPKENIDRLLNIKNYQFNTEKILTYLQNSTRQQFVLKEKYFTHSPKSLEIFSKILEDNSITSAEYGGHDGGTGCNGKNFISVARVNSEAYNFYAGSKTFILTDNICAFGKRKSIHIKFSDQFLNSKYPIRNPYYIGELHVLDRINLDKSIGIFVSQSKIEELIQITYLQEQFQNDIPLILFEDNTYVDKKAIKKYSKLLK